MSKKRKMTVARALLVIGALCFFLWSIVIVIFKLALGLR